MFEIILWLLFIYYNAVGSLFFFLYCLVLCSRLDNILQSLIVLYFLQWVSLEFIREFFMLILLSNLEFWEPLFYNFFSSCLIVYNSLLYSAYQNKNLRDLESWINFTSCWEFKLWRVKLFSDPSWAQFRLKWKWKLNEWNEKKLKFLDSFLFYCMLCAVCLGQSEINSYE